MKKIKGFERGMGIGGWLTNYKRFNVLPEDKRLEITIGDMEHFNSYITERDVAYIASLGMDHIRVGFDQIVLESEPYVYRREIIDLLHSFVSWCEKYSLRVVFNLHKAIGNYCDIKEPYSLMQDNPLQDRFIALWIMLENEFSNKPEIMFEILNEVRDVSASLWNNLATKALNEIRKINKKRYVIIGGAWWNSPNALKDLEIYDDDYVIYTFHNYEPFEFTHQRGVLQASTLYYNRVLDYPSYEIEKYKEYHRITWKNYDAYADLDAIDIKYIRRLMEPVKQFIEKNPDKIVWCGEFGTIRHIKIECRENFMKDMITVLKELDIPYSVWNYLSTPNDGNRFSLVDDDTRLILSDEMARIIRGDF